MSASSITVQWPYKTAAMTTTDGSTTYYWRDECRCAWDHYTATVLGSQVDYIRHHTAFLTPPANLSSLLPAGAQVIMIAFMLRTQADVGSTVSLYVNPGSTIPNDAQTALGWANTSTSTYVCPVPANKTDQAGWPCGTSDAEKIAAILTNGVFLAATERTEAKTSSPTYVTTQITYLDPTKAPIAAITEPADLVNRKTEDPLTVSWTYEQEASSPQTAALLEGSTNGVTWTTIGTVSGSDTSYTIPADTLAAGDWTLRLTVSSAYASAAPVTVRVKMRTSPATSQVSCDGLPHPTVSWTGADQTAYQVRFDTWDSGAVFGAATSLTVPRVYAAGVYPVTVRTQTSNGDWSDWSDTLWAEITNADPGVAPTLTVTRDRGAAVCSWTAVPGSAGYVLLRGSAEIYAGTDTGYRDELAVSGDVYVVRALTPDGYYTDSAPVRFTLPASCDMLRPLDDPDAPWIPIRHSLAPRSRSYDRSVATTFRHYAGREKPVAISAGESTRTMRTTVAFKTREQAEALLALAGRPVVYTDYNGGQIIGVVNPVGYDSERVYSVDMTITEIDWDTEDAVETSLEDIYDTAADRFVVVDQTAATAAAVKFILANNGTYTSAPNARSWMLEVPEGSTRLQIVAASAAADTAQFYGFLKSGTAPAANAQVDYCSGYEGRARLAAGMNDMALPADCTHVFVTVRTSGGTDLTPIRTQFEGDYVQGT